MIQADSATNSLIITAAEPVYRNLRAVIDQLDARRAQVYIEALIVELNSNTNANLGIQWQVANSCGLGRHQPGDRQRQQHHQSDGRGRGDGPPAVSPAALGGQQSPAGA